MTLHAPSYAGGFASRERGMIDRSLWDGVVGSWLPSLGTTGTTLRDHSGFASHGTLTTMSPATDWQPDGLDFDGSNDHVDMGDTAPLSVTGSMSALAWISCVDGQSTTQVPFGKWDSTGSSERAYLFRVETTGQIRTFLSVAGSSTDCNEISDAAVFPNGQTEVIQVGFVYSAPAQTIQLYADGKLLASTTSGTVPASIYDSVARFIIGAQDTGVGIVGPFKGTADEVTVWARALPASSVAELYRLGRGGIYRRQQSYSVKAPAAAGGLGIPFAAYHQFHNVGSNL